MTICLQNQIWNPTLCFLESRIIFWNRIFFWNQNWKFKTPFLESKMKSDRFWNPKRILKVTFGIQNGIRWNPKWKPAFFLIQIEIRFQMKSDGTFYKEGGVPLNPRN